MLWRSKYSDSDEGVDAEMNGKMAESRMPKIIMVRTVGGLEDGQWDHRSGKEINTLRIPRWKEVAKYRNQ